MLQAEDSPCPPWTHWDAAKWRAMQQPWSSGQTAVDALGGLQEEQAVQIEVFQSRLGA